MDLRYSLIIATLPISFGLFGQASLTAIDQPLIIDLYTTVPGVNNDLFDAQAIMGDMAPAPGQLDLDAWDYFADGTYADATGLASAFPGTLPAGNGTFGAGFMLTGVNATDINGLPAFGIQPTGGHFTAGSLTLRIVNNTGQALEQLAVAYTVGVLNDRDRSNAFRLFWSATNNAGSYVGVPAAEVISPLTLEDPAEWLVNDISVTLNGFSVPAGGSFYLRWVGDDVDGANQRDEFALANISLTPQVLSGPVLSTSVASLPVFNQVLGSPSAVASFTVSGSGMVDDVLVSLGNPFEVSVNGTSGFGTSIDLSPIAGVLNGVPVYVRLNNSQVGASSGSVTLSSAGVNTTQVTLSGMTTSANVPVLFINELQASNTGSPLDGFGEADDWFEIYNPNSFAVDLAGWYVSDDPTQLAKYTLHADSTNAIVPANGWLLVWADNQSSQGNLHTNFALSSTNGESILLTAPDGTTIVDQIVFSAQADGVSYGRESDGGTPWVTFTTSTPGASNNVVGLAESARSQVLHAWPVPTSDVLYLDRVTTGTVCDVNGRIVATVRNERSIDVRDLMPGSYFLRSVDGNSLRFVRE